MSSSSLLSEFSSVPSTDFEISVSFGIYTIFSIERIRRFFRFAASSQSSAWLPFLNMLLLTMVSNDALLVKKQMLRIVPRRDAFHGDWRESINRSEQSYFLLFGWWLWLELRKHFRVLRLRLSAICPFSIGGCVLSWETSVVQKDRDRFIKTCNKSVASAQLKPRRLIDGCLL